MTIITNHLSSTFCLCLVKTKTNPWFLFCQSNQNYNHNHRRLSSVKLQPPMFNLLPCVKHTSPKIADLLLDHLTLKPLKPQPKLQPETTKSSSTPQPRPPFVLHVRKAEDRPVGVIIPLLPEEVFVWHSRLTAMGHEAFRGGGSLSSQNPLTREFTSQSF